MISHICLKQGNDGVASSRLKVILYSQGNLNNIPFISLIDMGVKKEFVHAESSQLARCV
jgi:hypothetical protein